MWKKTVLLLLLISAGVAVAADALLRPREVLSKRRECLEPGAYQELAQQWQNYYREQPSEYAAANRLYAMRYAQDEKYEKELAKALRKYPANPTLLYLQGLELAVRYQSDTRAQALEYLELAHRLDPAYDDPLFMLSVMYMQQGDDAATDQALSDLLSMGAISDVILDYGYNMLACLPLGSVLLTNGDNDTYPCWILQRVLDVRPDLTVINQSLMNTNWYPLYMIRQGLPLCITASELEQLQTKLTRPLSEVLMERVLQEAQLQGRPVCFASTLAPTSGLESLMERGESLGLATLVQTGEHKSIFDPACWISQWRTAGMDSYSLRYQSATNADRLMLRNYLSALATATDPQRVPSLDTRRALFYWFTRHLAPQFPVPVQQQLAAAFGRGADLPEVDIWLKEQGWKP